MTSSTTDGWLRYEKVHGRRHTVSGNVWVWPSLISAELSHAREIVVYCKGGVRSLRAATQLRAAGFRKVSNLTGGILRWSADVDPSVPTY